MPAHEGERGAPGTLMATILDGVATLRSVLIEEATMRAPAAIAPDSPILPVTPHR
jgi:hypothetical protein